MTETKATKELREALKRVDEIAEQQKRSMGLPAHVVKPNEEWISSTYYQTVKFSPQLIYDAYREGYQARGAGKDRDEAWGTSEAMKAVAAVRGGPVYDPDDDAHV